MRFLLRFLAFFDALALVLMTMQIIYISTHFDEKILLSEKVESILMFPMYLLILVGAIGLFFFKKYAFILYYIQFPFRLYLSIFTIGFITLLPEAFESYDDKWPAILIKLCFVAEVIRLYLTIGAHRKLANN
jgi:hypothetical protein